MPLRRIHILAFDLIVLVIVCLSAAAADDGSSYSEDDIKAAYLYNFARFVQWPDAVIEETDSLEICVFGPHPFESTLEDIVYGQTANGRPIEVRYADDISDVVGCHLLYIADVSDAQLQEALTIAEDRPILTVSDRAGFAEDLGLIGFYLDDDRVKFEVNRSAANDRGLTFSSRLLKIARIVDGEE